MAMATLVSCIRYDCCIRSIRFEALPMKQIMKSVCWKANSCLLLVLLLILLCARRLSSPYNRDIAMRTSRAALDTSGGASGSPFLMWLVIDEEAKQGTTISEYNCRGFSAIRSVLTWLHHSIDRFVCRQIVTFQISPLLLLYSFRSHHSSRKSYEISEVQAIDRTKSAKYNKLKYKQSIVLVEAFAGWLLVTKSH